jgi:glycosyltransferase involved in cell wall biosynthesis
LDNIFNQLAKSEIINQVELVVSDNDSTDGTKALVKEYAAKYNNVCYYKNEKNLGFDRNVDCVLTKATGDFCWLMSDDDYIKDGAIEFVLNILKDNIDVAFVGICDGHQSVGGDYKIFADGSECLDEIGIFCGGVPMCIFKREYLPVDRMKYHGNYWIHLSMAVEIVAKRKLVMVKNLFRSQEPVIARWANDGAVFYSSINIRKIFKDALNFGYDKRVIGKIVHGLTVVMPRNMASAKLRGLRVSWDKFKFLYSQFSDSLAYLFILTVIFVCPTFILRMIRKIEGKST